MDRELFKVVEIEINSHCNLSCSYCPNHEFQRKEKGVMPLKDYQSIIDQLKDLKFIGRISHEFYGEPTLHPQFNDIVEYTKCHLPDSKIELYSNATKLNQWRIKDLLEAGIDEFIITKHEGQKLYDFEEALGKLEQGQLDHITYRNHDDIYKTNRGGILKNTGEGPQPLLPCFIPSFLMAITLKGNALPCFEDFFQHHEMGNVFEQSIEEIWFGAAFTKFREDLKKGLRHKYAACKDCSRVQTLMPEDVRALNKDRIELTKKGLV